jgi:uncharacterized membrane protein
MLKFSVKKITYLAMSVALSAALTVYPKIPNGVGGFIHFSNLLMYLCAALFGPLEGGITGGVGILPLGSSGIM